MRIFLTSVFWLPWWLRQLSVCLHGGRPGFNPWVRKISRRRKWQPTPVFLPGKFHGWRSLVGYSPWGHKESDTTEWLHFGFFFVVVHLLVLICFLSPLRSQYLMNNMKLPLINQRIYLGYFSVHIFQKVGWGFLSITKLYWWKFDVCIPVSPQCFRKTLKIFTFVP